MVKTQVWRHLLRILPSSQSVRFVRYFWHFGRCSWHESFRRLSSLRLFCSVCSVCPSVVWHILHQRPPERNHWTNQPLFEFSFKGSIFEVSIMPGLPSTTPAVWLKFRVACLSPSKLAPAPAPRSSVVGSATCEDLLAILRPDAKHMANLQSLWP